MSIQAMRLPTKLCVASAPVVTLPIPDEDVVSGLPHAQWKPVWQSEDGALLNGVWHCTPGVFYMEHPNEMFCLVEGHATITPENGEPIDVRGGDAVFMPAGTRVKWEVHKTVRKAFFGHTPRS